ncbi:MAG: hypothetical protein R2932_31300 [Caldilineaceae bacterium]
MKSTVVRYTAAQKAYSTEHASVPSAGASATTVGSALMQAMERGDHDQFAALLAEDVELHSDGGGKVAAATNPLHGRTTIMRFLPVSIANGHRRPRLPSAMLTARWRFLCVPSARWTM